MGTYKTIVMTGVSQYSDHSAEYRCSIPGPTQCLCNRHHITLSKAQRQRSTADQWPPPSAQVTNAWRCPTRLHCVVLKSTVFPSTDTNRIKPCCLRKIQRTFHFTIIKVHLHLRNEGKNAGLSAIRTQKANCNTSVCYSKLQILTITSTKFIE